MNQNAVPIEDILSLAEALITIPSVSGEVDKAVEIIEFTKTQLSGFSFTPFVSNSIPSLLYTNTEKEKKHFTIILNAHLDVVPGIAEQYKPFVKDGKLYGRGAYDMKAAAAANIILFKELSTKLPYALGLQLTTDEETSGINGAEYQLKQGVRAKFVITGECGSNFRIVHESKGLLQLKLISRGLASHSAYPWRGKNAVMQMYEAIDALYKAYPQPVEEAYETTINVTHINTPNSLKHTVTPDYCEAILDARYLPNEHHTIIKKLQSLLPDGVKIEILLHTPPHRTDSQNTYLLALQKTAKKILQKEVPIIKQHATSDARHYSNFGCEGVEFGPIGANQHNQNEYIDIQSVGMYYQILRSFLLNLD